MMRNKKSILSFDSIICENRISPPEYDPKNEISELVSSDEKDYQFVMGSDDEDQEISDESDQPDGEGNGAVAANCTSIVYEEGEGDGENVMARLKAKANTKSMANAMGVPPCGEIDLSETKAILTTMNGEMNVKAHYRKAPSNLVGYSDESNAAHVTTMPTSFRSDPKPFKNKYRRGTKYDQHEVQIAVSLQPSFIVDDSDRDEILPEIDSCSTKNMADLQIFEQVRNEFKVTRVSERTLVYAVVKNKSADKNAIVKIRCFGGIAFGGYARDSSSDSFIVKCVDYIQLGTIPFGYKISMPKTDSWEVQVPIPENVLEKTLTPPQRKALSDFREKYPSKNFEISYLQMTISH